MNRLQTDVLAGRYGPSGRLPTEFELCEIYGLSRTPVARALRDLAEAGVVVRHRRRGTFVNPAWLSSHTGAQPELRVLGPGPSWAARVRSLVPAEVRLRIESPGMGDLQDTFRQQIAEGHGPDLVVVDSVWVAEFARAHFLTTLTELDDTGWLEQALESDFLPPFGRACRHDGSVVAVHGPVHVTGLWYVRSAVPDPPRTWPQLHSAGLSLARTGDWDHALMLPGGVSGSETTTSALVALLAANGASVLSDEAVTLDSPAAVEAMAFLRQLVDDEIVPVKAAGFAGHDSVRLFAEGHAAMCVGASDQAGDIAAWARIDVENVLDTFGFAPLPSGPSVAGPSVGGVLAGGMAYAIPRQSAHPELALNLLRTLISTDALVRQCLRNGQLPPRRSALDQVTASSPFHAAAGQMLRRAILRPVTPAYALVSDQLQAMISDVIAGRVRPAAAISHAAETISAVTRLPLA